MQGVNTSGINNCTAYNKGTVVNISKHCCSKH